jgi:hypothetical protein
MRIILTAGLALVAVSLMASAVSARDGAPRISTAMLRDIGLRDMLVINDTDGLRVRGRSTIAIWGRSVTLRNSTTLSNYYRDNNYSYGHNLAITMAGPFGRLVIAGGTSVAGTSR